MIVNKKAFAITGLMFVFVALIFAAANHIYFANEAKQKSINFAFVADSVNSISIDFPKLLLGEEGSVVDRELFLSACDTPKPDVIKQLVVQAVSKLNWMLMGTGIEIKINSAQYNTMISSCPCGDTQCCGSSADIVMDYTIRTPNFERRNSFSEHTKVCTLIRVGQKFVREDHDEGAMHGDAGQDLFDEADEEGDDQWAPENGEEPADEDETTV